LIPIAVRRLHRQFEKYDEALLVWYKCNSLNYDALFEIATTYEEFNFNKTLALNYYKRYLKEAGDKAKYRLCARKDAEN